MELISQQEFTFEAKQEEFKPAECLHFHSQNIVKNGKNIKTSIQRYKYNGCIFFLFNYRLGDASDS